MVIGATVGPRGWNSFFLIAAEFELHADNGSTALPRHHVTDY
jgi:hypothetical protein